MKASFCNENHVSIKENRPETSSLMLIDDDAELRVVAGHALEQVSICSKSGSRQTRMRPKSRRILPRPKMKTQGVHRKSWDKQAKRYQRIA